jgi:rhamnosyltransferase
MGYDRNNKTVFLTRDTLMTKTAAIIVLYHPDPSELDALIERLRPQCNEIILGDNSSLKETLSKTVTLFAQCIYIDMGHNAGVAAAQNAGIQQAKQLGCSHVVLFDQDSLPASDMIEKLLTAMQNLEAQGTKVAAVGPVYSSMMRYIKSRPEPHVKKNHLISSGILISLQTLDAVGLMEEKLFIDDVDTEWCYRALSKGFQLFNIRSAMMEHHLGHQKKVFFNSINVTIHNPGRYYYLFRNHLWLLNRNYIPFKAKLTLLSQLGKLTIKIVFLNNKIDYLKNLFHGLRDGFFQKEIGS